MSLVELIREREVRERLTALVKNRPRLDGLTLQAEPHTKNYGIVGTAFDYLFRFGLQRLNESAKTTRWVAESGLRVIRGGGHFNMFSHPEEFNQTIRGFLESLS